MSLTSAAHACIGEEHNSLEHRPPTRGQDPEENWHPSQQPSTANSFSLVGRASYAPPSTSLLECLLARSCAGPMQAVTSTARERHYGWSLSHLLALTVLMPHLPWCSLSLRGGDVTWMFHLGLKHCHSFLHFRTTWIWRHTIAYF